LFLSGAEEFLAKIAKIAKKKSRKENQGTESE
jgi:hypothetical protein